MSWFNPPETIYVGPDGASQKTVPGMGNSTASSMSGTTDRLNNFADRVRNVNARQTAAIVQPLEQTAQTIRDFGTGTRNVLNAGAQVLGAVASNPLVRVGGGLIAGKFALDDAKAANQAYDSGDKTGAGLYGLRSGVEAASILPGPVGLAASGGLLAGTVIDKGLQQFESGRYFRDKLGGFLAGEDARNKVAAAEDMLSGGTGAIPPKPAPTAAAPAATSTVAPTVAPPPTAPAPVAPTNPAGLVSRQGNSFSGNNVRAGFSYEDGPGSRPSTGAFSVLPSGGVMNDSLGGMDGAVHAAKMAALNRGESLGPGYVVQIGNSAPGFNQGNNSIPSRSDTDSRIRDFMRSGLSARQAASMALQENTLAEQRRAADQTASVTTAGNNLNANVSTRGQDLSASTTTRGQDLTYAANRATVTQSIRQAERDQFNKDRDYQAGRLDQGFRERQEREQALQRNIEAQAPVDPKTGKPDANYVRDVRAGLERSAGRLGVNGPQDFSPQVEQQLMAANSLLKIMRENSGNIPFLQPDKLKTIDPVDLTDLRVLPNGDRQITRKDSKAMGQTIPKRFFDTEEGNRIRMFGTPTNRYDILSSQGAGQ